jgi:hypothetical protein
LSGSPLDPAKAFRRRKRICRDWWNYEWLSRLTAVTHWLADGRESLELIAGPTGSFVLSGQPLQLVSPVGINEGALAAVQSADDSLTLDDTPEDDNDFAT